MNHVTPILVCLLALCVSLATPFTVKIIAVIDSADAQYETSLERAVQYLNSGGSGLLSGHSVTIDTVLSKDNGSFVAMDAVCTKIQNGVTLILDTSSRYVTEGMRSLAEGMGIAYVSMVDSAFEADPTAYNVSVNFHPPASIMLESIRSIVSQENLTNVGILFDDTFDLNDKPKRLLRNIPAQHLYLYMATTDASIDDQLDKIKTAELEHLFLASTAANAGKYLGRANAKGMMNFRYSWYVLTKDTKVTCSACTAASSVLSLIGITESSPLNTYVSFINSITASAFTTDDVEMAAAFHFDVVNIIGKALDGMLTGGSLSEINYVDCYQYNFTDSVAFNQAVAIRNAIKAVSYTGVFGAFAWSGNIAQESIRLNILPVAFNAGVATVGTSVGYWTMADGLKASAGTIANKNVARTYRVVTVVEPPFVFRDVVPPSKPGVKSYYNATSGYYYYGYCIDLIMEINKTMGFEFTLHEPADGAYGSMQTDGSWNGMIEELKEDRGDIAVAPLSVMAERENVIDFTVPYYDLVGITILMKKPKFEYSVFKFMTVLEEAVWGCVFSAFIIVSILLAVFDKFSPYSYQNNKTSWNGDGDEPRIFTLKEGLWFCMTSLTPQGGGEAPRALSGRLVAATWWMFGFIMIATYTANLAAFLTVSRLDQPIESLDDLAKQFKTKYAPQASTSTETYFRRMADIEEKFYTIWKAMSLNDSLDQMERAKLAVWDYPVSDKFTNMWVAMQDSGFPPTFSQAIERVKVDTTLNPNAEEFAFIGDATQNKYATLTDCDLWEVGEEFSRKPYALAVQEGSPLKNELSSVILQLLNQRFLEDLKTTWWEYNKVECPKIEDESDGISIKNIGGVFLVIFIGIGLGLLTLAFEYYWYKWRPAAKNKSTTVAVRQAHDNPGYNNSN